MIKFFTKNLWLWKCGLPEMNIERIDLMDLKKTQWSDEFEQLRRNRLIVGAMRYGKLNAENKVQYDRTSSIQKKLLIYRKTKNKEVLVDIANLCMVEFEEGDGIFKALDDEGHTTVKGK